MTQATHTPTPISTRMATIAKGQNWKDNSHYGDTDYGLSQEFEQGPHLVRLTWGPDGRHGASDELLSVSVTDNRFRPLVKTVFHVEGRSQDYMRAAVVEAIYYYSQDQ
jgi:hypothetical protein